MSRRTSSSDSGQLNAWARMTDWTLVLPPSRPSFDQLQLIRESVGPIARDQPVAILGCTPEFRDLLCEMGFTQVFVLDHSRHAYDLMTALRVTNGPEQFIHGDWVNSLRQYPSIFHVILSDLTSGNLPYERLPTFYDAVRMSLAPEGIFIDKILTHPIDFVRVEDLWAKYSSRPVNLTEINYFSCEMLFCSELMATQKVVDSSRFYEFLEDRAIGERLQAFVQLAKRITPPGFVWYYGEQWRNLKPLYAQGMRLIDQWNDFPGSPYYGRVKIFRMRKG